MGEMKYRVQHEWKIITEWLYLSLYVCVCVLLCVYLKLTRLDCVRTS